MISTHKAETGLRLSRKDQDLLNVMNLLQIIFIFALWEGTQSSIGIKLFHGLGLVQNIIFKRLHHSQ